MTFTRGSAFVRLALARAANFTTNRSSERSSSYSPRKSSHFGRSSTSRVIALSRRTTWIYRSIIVSKIARAATTNTAAKKERSQSFVSTNTERSPKAFLAYTICVRSYRSSRKTRDDPNRATVYDYALRADKRYKSRIELDHTSSTGRFAERRPTFQLNGRGESRAYVGTAERAYIASFYGSTFQLSNPIQPDRRRFIF
uniref:Uncharacterized protein n=1 Tax=Trichogramma kaykai TaxID=54128 RepID=A0ABD2XKY0_9HYME